MKKIAFIIPNLYGIVWQNDQKSLSHESIAEIIKNRTYFGTKGTPNPSLLTVAGVVPDAYSICYIDEINGMKIPFDEYFDIVVLSATTNQANRIYDIARLFKNNGSYVVLGGIHASVMPNEALQHVDAVFVGEGEDIFLAFLDDMEKGSPKKIYYSKRYVDISKSPIPRYDIVDPNLFSFYCVQTTRGCPRKCHYCSISIMYGSIYRQKNINQVINEVKAIQAIDTNAFIFFSDDNMFINREYSKKLLREVTKLGIKWGTQTDISIANDDELMKLIHESGCHWLFIGFENVTQNGLDFLANNQWKSNTRDNYERAIAKIRNNGINIWGGFMFGGDSDTIDIFEQTLDFIIKRGIFACSFSVVTPFPGTQLYKKMFDSGRIIEHNWEKYNICELVFKPLHMTPEELVNGIEWLYESFYCPKRNKLTERGEETYV
jgi:radical SAM superfamily enzyme YgiQ (UPF0313 family)